MKDHWENKSMRMYECTKEFKTTLFDKNEIERIKIFASEFPLWRNRNESD